MMIQKIIGILRKYATHLGISQWSVEEEERCENQIYILGKTSEQERTVRSRRAEILLLADSGARQGRIRFSLSPSQMASFPKMFKEAAELARLNPNRPYRLAGPHEAADVALADPMLKEAPDDLLYEIRTRSLKTLHEVKNLRSSTLEAFSSFLRVHLANSEGVQMSREETVILLDLAILADSETCTAESHGVYQRRRFSDLHLEEIVEKHSRRASDALRSRLPRTGIFPVIVSGEALSPFFHPFIVHASGYGLDKKLSLFAPGESVYLGCELRGDALKLFSNAIVPFGWRSYPFDRDGLPGRRLKLICEGAFCQYWTTKEYADYLGMEATGSIGNLEVTPGSASFDDLLSGERLYHIIEFSHMRPDIFSGDFVAEIRQGYEHCRGKVTPIKGGSVSGNVFAAFSQAHFSREVVFLGDYLGPKGIRFEGLSVAGE